MSKIELDLTKKFGRVYGGALQGGYHQFGLYFRPDGRYYGKSPDEEDPQAGELSAPLPQPEPPPPIEVVPAPKAMHPNLKKIIELPIERIVVAVNSVIADAKDKGTVLKPADFVVRTDDTDEAKLANAEFLLANTELGDEPAQ